MCVQKLALHFVEVSWEEKVWNKENWEYLVTMVEIQRRSLNEHQKQLHLSVVVVVVF